MVVSRCSTGKLDSEEERSCVLAAVSGQQERCRCRPRHPAVMAVATALWPGTDIQTRLCVHTVKRGSSLLQKKCYASHWPASGTKIKAASRLEARLVIFAASSSPLSHPRESDKRRTHEWHPDVRYFGRIHGYKCDILNTSIMTSGLRHYLSCSLGP